MEFTVSQAAKEFGLSVEHVLMLIKRGILPKGHKQGRYRYLPCFETRLILSMHDSNTRWPKPVSVTQADWDALI